MESKYKSMIFSVKSDATLDMITKKDNLMLSKYMPYPQFNLGYHSFLTRTRNAMNVTNNLETKNEFYYVVNPFEVKINDYKNDINNITKKRFNLDKDIEDQGFFKLWEILKYHDLVSRDKLTFASIGESKGTFLQAISLYRKELKEDLSSDRYFSVSINQNEKLKPQLLNYFYDEYPKLINIQKTYPKEKSKKYTSRSSGDIREIKTISLFKKEIKKEAKRYADLVIGNGKIDGSNKDNLEQYNLELIIGEIIAGLRVQGRKGSFILRVFDIFTNTTLKLLYLTSCFYEEMYIHKPHYSRTSDNEFFIIFKKFKYEQKKDKSLLEEKIGILENILENVESDKFIQDIFLDMDVDSNFINQIKYINKEITNEQQIMINKIVVYIKENNYFGEKYHEYRDNQIEATKFWGEKFFEKDLRNELEKIINYNTKESELFTKRLS